MLPLVETELFRNLVVQQFQPMPVACVFWRSSSGEVVVRNDDVVVDMTRFSVQVCSDEEVGTVHEFTGEFHASGMG